MLTHHPRRRRTVGPQTLRLPVFSVSAVESAAKWCLRASSAVTEHSMRTCTQPSSQARSAPAGPAYPALTRGWVQARPRRPRRPVYRCAAVLATQPPPPSFSGTDGDTVAAIVTPVVPQTGGVAIVRVSGDEAVSVVRRIFWPGPRARTRSAWAAESHRAVYGSVCEDDGSVVDEARRVAARQELCLLTPSPSGSRPAHAEASLLHARGRRGGALPRRKHLRAAGAVALPGARHMLPEPSLP